MNDKQLDEIKRILTRPDGQGRVQFVLPTNMAEEILVWVHKSYISYEEVERLIPDKYVIQPETDKEGRIYEGGYNQAIAELKAALIKRRESK